MKKIIKFICAVLIIGFCLFGISCKDPDNTIHDFTNNSGTNNSGSNTGNSDSSSENKPNDVEIPELSGSVVNGSVQITKSAGWFNSCYVEFLPYTDAEAYLVNVDGIKIDDSLVRYYDEYVRADALGLKSGEHTISVQGIMANGDVTEASSATVTVVDHDRSGYAFTGEQTPGAYKMDGSLKDDAVVLYVTASNAKTVSYNGIKGLQNIIGESNAKKYTVPLCVRIIGKVSIDDVDSNSKGWSSSEGLQIKNNKSPITIEGVGEDATIWGFGLMARNSSYIEYSNLAVMNFMDDGISLDTGNKYTWVHNMDFFYGSTGGDADQAKGDGTLDVKGNSMYQTYSYNHFWDSGKASLCGMKSETGPNYITYHHNWFDHSDSRHPRVRTMTVHVYNNYYDGNSKYGVGGTTGADIFVERNYFRNCKFPMMSSLQGNDVYAGTSSYKPNDYGTFSGESGGSIKAYDNYIEGSQTSFIGYGDTEILMKGQTVSASSMDIDTKVHFDAYVVNNRNDLVPETVIAFAGGDTYSNFDTSSNMYKYNVDTPQIAKQNVENYAGRINGGDFKWDFDDATEDTNYNVITDLKDAITAYKSKLVAVQGIKIEDNGNTDSGDSGNTDAGDSGNTDAPIDLSNAVTVTFDNFTTGATINGVTITGNLKSGIPSKAYNSVTYTSALKIESQTIIDFVLDKAAKIILVTDGASKKIKINGTSFVTDVNGILETTIEAGSVAIRKGDTMNLYAIIINSNN